MGFVKVNNMWLSFFVIIVVAIRCIKSVYVPDDSINTQRNIKNVGIKTLSWQENNGNNGSIQLHHNYSRVYHSNYPNGSFHEETYAQSERNRTVNINDHLENFSDQQNFQDQKINGNLDFSESINNQIQFSDTENHANKVVFGDQSSQVYTACPNEATGSFVYEYSCSQFLNCWKGRGHVQNCAPGTLFNPKSLECDYAEKVQCVSGPNRVGRGIQISAKLTQASCPHGFTGFIPHYTVCTKYIHCNNGQGIPMDCPAGTTFDVKTNTCDFPYKSECATSTSHNQIEQNEYQNTNSGFRKRLVVIKPYHRNVTYVFKPSQFGTDSGFSGKDSTGRTYHILGNPQRNVIINDQLGEFSSNRQGSVQWGQSVEHPHHISHSQTGSQNFQSNYGDFGGRQYQGMQQGSQHGRQQQQHQSNYLILLTNEEIQNLGFSQNPCFSSNNEIYEHPSNCSVFLQCFRGKLHLGICTLGTYYNPASKICKHYNCQKTTYHQSGSGGYQTSSHSTSSSVNALNSPKCPPGQSGLYPHPSDCTKFLNCDHGRTFIQECGPGTVFNPKIKVCDWPRNVQCTSDGQHDNTTSKIIEENSGQEGYNQQNNSYDQNIDFSRFHGVNPNEVCIGKEGFYENTKNCITFFSCRNGILSVGVCHPGSNFNPTTKDCDNSYRCQQTSGGLFDQYHVNYDQYNQASSQHQGNQENLHPIYQNQHYDNQNAFVQRSDQWPSQSQTSYHYQGNRQHHQRHQHQPDNYQHQHTGQNIQQINQSQAGSFQHTGGQRFIHQNYQHQYQRQNQSQVGSQIFTPQDHQHQGRFYVNHAVYDHQHHRANKTKVDVNMDQTLVGFEQSARPVLTTDTNADYIFELDDLVEVEPGAGNGCAENDFICQGGKCLKQSALCNGVKDCSNGEDENNCGSYLTQFKQTKRTKMAVKEVAKFQNTTIALCAKKCLEADSFKCKSFNYRKNDGMCFMLDTNIGHSGSLFLLPNYDYYENQKYSIDCTGKFVCSNQKCIENVEICDGKFDCVDKEDEKNCDAKKIGYSIQLVGSNRTHEGAVQVTAFGKTGFVCDDQFGMKDAHVVCKELGFEQGALEVKSNLYFNVPSEVKDNGYLMDDVSCIGNETSLKECNFNGWGIHNCMSKEIVGVVCKSSQATCPMEKWKCETTSECIPLDFLCDHVSDCGDKSDEANQYCESPIEIRLVDGKRHTEGRLEIKYHGTWGTVCDDDFNDDAAKVVCRHLGHEGPATAKKNGAYGPGKGPIWLDQVFCQGNETSLQECDHWDFGKHNCDHSEDVGITCEDYTVHGTPRNVKILNQKLQPPRQILPGRCGFRNDNIFSQTGDVHFRLVKGNIAEKGSYPWQASIRVKGQSSQEHWCGAVVISENFVLSAAHCLSGYQKGGFVIVAGDYDRNEEEGTEQVVNIEEFYVHPDFRKGTKMNNDISMIKLKGSGFTLGNHVQAICLPKADFEEETLNCTISGFGSVQSGKAVASRELRAGFIPIQTREVCSMPHVYGEALTEGMICAGTLDGGIDACDGDSGGPLACLKDGVFTLIGLTSWGQHCGYANKPGVYVKISHYRNWIEQIMKRHSS